ARLGARARDAPRARLGTGARRARLAATAALVVTRGEPVALVLTDLVTALRDRRAVLPARDHLRVRLRVLVRDVLGVRLLLRAVRHVIVVVVPHAVGAHVDRVGGLLLGEAFLLDEPVSHR